MKKIDVLNKAITKAIKADYDFGIDNDDWEELSDIERIVILRAIADNDIACLGVIFNREFAEALWGDEKYMAYYAGYDQWADATDYDEEDAAAGGFDEIARDRMPLFEYHLMMMARARDRLKYLSENI